MGTPMPHPKIATPRWLATLPLTYLLTGLGWIVGSDLVVGWLYRDDLRALVYASTLKGGLFVILTATLLYVLLAMRRVEFVAESRGLSPFELRKPLIAFALVGLGIASIGYVVYLLEADGLRNRARQQLESEARVAATQFSLWHEGRVRSMLQVAGSPFTARAIAEWRSQPSTLLETLLHERLAAIRSSQEYRGVAALALDGTVMIEAGLPLQVTTELRQVTQAAAASERVLSSWTTLDAEDGRRQPVVDLVVALRDPLAPQHGVVAIIVARADVRWPLHAVTPDQAKNEAAVVVLARVEGGQIGFLQPAAGGSGGRYVLMPRAQTASSIAYSVQGASTAAVTRNPAGREVLANGFPVGGTPWYAVASIELATIEQQIRRLMLLIAGMSALGFMATAALVLPWWRSVRAGATALIRSAESRADEMAARLGWVTRHANDVILLIGAEGQILDVNDRAEQVYGYTRAELLALDVFSLRLAGEAQHAAARAQYETVVRQGSLVFEAIHVRKDGTSFPVEVSSRRVALDGQQYVQSIVRDITDRRRAEEKLRESEAKYRLLFKSNPHPMWVYDVDTLCFLAVNDMAVETYGYSESEFLAMTIAEIRPSADRERLEADVREHADDLMQRSGLWRHCRKDGTIIDVEISSHWIEFDDRRARLVLATDVTSRLTAERALRLSEERYRSLFDCASDGILVLAADRRVQAANAEYLLMLGYSFEELHGVNLDMLLDESEHARLERVASDVLHGNLPGPAAWVHRRKDGSRFTAEVRIRVLPGGELLATVRDLTEIIAARQRIERQRDLYDLLSQCNQAIVKTADRHELLQSVARLAVDRGHFLFAWIGEVNEAGDIVPTAKYGEDQGYVASLRLGVAADSPGGNGPSGRALREGTVVVVNDFLGDPQTVCWHEAGRRCGVGASAAFPIHAGGKVTAALMLYAGQAGYFDAEICATLEEMTTDVSYALDSLRTRRELEDSRLLLQSLIDAADALVFVFDLDGRAILMNDACARAMGGTRASLIGHRRQEVMPAAAAQAHESNDRRVIESGEHLVVEELNTESGVERVYLSVKYPLRNVEGRVYAVGGIATDITELRRMQRELAESNRILEARVAERTSAALAAQARAEAADLAKTQFLSSMSHELRSPLHSIIGFTSVLLEGLEGELTPPQQEHLRVVSDASHHLLAIINDLLDMSKIEAGALALEFRPLPLRRPLDQVMQRFRLQAQAKGLEMRLECAEPEIWIEGDERRIEQILSNLVSNAIKYTTAGSVRVGCCRHNDHVRIDVTDTGPGIAADDQQQLFKRFSQLKPSRGELVEGTGLGLAIAAGLAEAMGGEIVLQSEPGVGSTFSLLLPSTTTGEQQ